MSKRKLIDSPWLYFAAALLLLVAAALSQVEINRKVDRPMGEVGDLLELRDRDDLNVIFIVIDMLRADRLGAYGYARQTSPNLDRLAATSIRFRAVESQSSWTKASMASLWTGKYPQRTGILRYNHAMPEEALLPAEILRDAGFRTAGVWRNGWLANNFGFGQGFELYVRPKGLATQKMVRGRPGGSRISGSDWDATEVALEFIESNKRARFFLYVHYMDVHQFVHADSSPIWGTELSDFYDASIHWTDRNIGLMIDALRDRNLLDKTLIVIASDHGEAFFEHGQEGHARSLYLEVQEVPLLIVPPFRLPGGVVVDPRVANVDIWPTLLDLLGQSELPEAEGRSLVPLILAAADPALASAESEALAKRPVYSQLDRAWGKVDMPSNPLIAMAKDPYRLIVDINEPQNTSLFDNTDDPRELENVAQDQPDLVKELRAEVDAFLDAEAAIGLAPEEVELDEMRLHQLRALGYVIERGKPEEDAAEPGEEGESPAEPTAGDAVAP
jgi:arylsulfatase A-like enzyme